MSDNKVLPEPEKPLSAYALFFRETVGAIKLQNPNSSFKELSQIVSSMWVALDPTDKTVYIKKNELACAEYAKALQSYRKNSECVIINDSNTIDLDSTNAANKNTNSANKNSITNKLQNNHRKDILQTSSTSSAIADRLTSSVTSAEEDTLTDGVIETITIDDDQYQVASVYHGNNNKSKLLNSDQKNSNVTAISTTNIIGNRKQIQSTSPVQTTSNLTKVLTIQNLPTTTKGAINLKASNVKIAVPLINITSPVRSQPTELMNKSKTTDSDPETSSKKPAINSTEMAAASTSATKNEAESAVPQICTRANCNKPAIVNPDWEDEYCSNECVVMHCRDVFEAWVRSTQEGRKT